MVKHRWLLIGPVAAVLAAASPQARGQSADDKDEIQARALFVEANQRLDRGDYAGAAELYEEAYRRFPDNPKILLNLGTAQARWGHDAAAANTYQLYLDHPKADPAKLAAVRKSLADLDRKVAILEIEIEEPDARVRLDSQEIGAAPQKFSRRVEIGPHLIAAEKEGFTPGQATVTVAAGEVRSIQLRLIRRPSLKASSPPPAISAPAQPVASPVGEPAVAPLATTAEISHAGRAGLFIRLDADGHKLGDGADVAIGGSYGVLPSLELEVAGLAGASFGAWGGATLYLGGNRWKPLITAGLPVYFLHSGTLLGVHGAAGVEWNLNTHTGVLICAGVQYYIDPPMDIVRAVFVPSVAFSYRR
jgi:hypothetical protein